MELLRTLLIPVRFLKAMAWIGLTYVLAHQFFHRLLIPARFEKIGIIAFEAVVSFLGIKIHRQMLNKNPLPSNAIYICNHSSSFEVFIMPCVLRNTDYVIDANVLKIPVIRKILKKSPLIFVDRKSTQSRSDCITEIGKRITNDRNVMLFPEGYSHKYLGSQFAIGAFLASFNTKTPIVPLYMHYDNLDAFVPDEKVDHKKEFFRILFSRNKRITAYFFDSIMPTDYQTVEDYRDAIYQMYVQWQKKYYGV